MALSTRLPCPTRVVLPGGVIDMIYSADSRALVEWATTAEREYVEYALEVAATEGATAVATALIPRASRESRTRALESAVMCQRVGTVAQLAAAGAPASVGTWKMIAYRDDTDLLKAVLGLELQRETHSYLPPEGVRRLLVHYKATCCLCLWDSLFLPQP